jgi:hypothetical protein
MHARYMPRDESWRMDVSMRRSRQRRSHGGKSLSFFFTDRKTESTSSDGRCTAMLRHRLHFTHRGQRNGPPQLTTSVPITVRPTRELAPAPARFDLTHTLAGLTSLLPRIGTLARSPVVLGAFSLTPTSITAKSSNKPKQNHRFTPASSR